MESEAKRQQREEAENKAVELIETTAAAARALIAETTEHALALLAEAVIKATKLVQEETEHGEAQDKEATDILAEAVSKGFGPKGSDE